MVFRGALRGGGLVAADRYAEENSGGQRPDRRYAVRASVMHMAGMVLRLLLGVRRGGGCDDELPHLVLILEDHGGEDVLPPGLHLPAPCAVLLVEDIGDWAVLQLGIEFEFRVLDAED